MKTLFSAHGAAELLEKDRATMVRAMRGVPPNGTERGQNRWTMRTIVDAVARHENTSSSNGTNGNADTGQRNVDRICAEFDAAFQAMLKVKSLEKRRDIALTTLAPIIEAHSIAMHERGRVINDEFVTGLLADKLYGLMLAGFQEPCSWSRDETWSRMAAAMPSAFADE